MVYRAEVEAAKDTSSKKATAAQARIYEGQFVVEGRDMVLGMVRRNLNNKFNIDQPLFGHTCIHLDPEERHDRFLIDRELLDE